jgi:GTPase SAR1 family protein
MRVFIGHTSEIRSFPNDHPFLKAALDGAREAGWGVEEMGDFPATALPPPAECERRVQQCDAFVAIVGFLWGSAVPGKPDTSYVALELQAAEMARKPTLIFVIDSAFAGFPAGLIQGLSPKEHELQRQFRQRVLNGPTCKTISNAQQLHHEVYRALSGLEKGIPEHDSRAQHEPLVSIERLPPIGGEMFGRDLVLRELERIWSARSAHIVCLVGSAGMGKTALVNAWLANLATEDYRGAQAVFGWSFESQEIDQSEASAETFVDEALKFFGEFNPPATPVERGRRLAELVRAQSAILVLDGLEAVQDPRDPHELMDPAAKVLLKMLAAQNRGVCLVTSLIEVSELKPFAGKIVKVIPVEELSLDAGRALLRSFQLWPEHEFADAVTEYTVVIHSHSRCWQHA